MQHFLFALLFLNHLSFESPTPPAEVSFSIDVSGTDFKIAKYVTGTLVYTTDGNVSTDKPLFIVGNSSGVISHGGQKKYCMVRVKRLPGGETNIITKVNPLRIDKLPGYEIIAEGKNSAGKEQFVYQVILFSEKGYYILLGMSPIDSQNSLKSFKRIAMSFKRKR